MGEELKLLGFNLSSYVCRVRIALKLKGVEYEYLDLDVYENKDPLIIKYNPVHKKVPVLLHNGKAISESLLIVEYIDETWNSGISILPRDPYERAVARFWAKFIDEKCTPAIWKAAWSKGEEQEKHIEEAHELLKTLEKELKGNRFFGGDRIGLVDITGAFIGYSPGIIQDSGGPKLLTEEKLPELYKWSNEFVNCETVKEALPSKELLYEFGNIYRGPGAPNKEHPTRRVRSKPTPGE